jgi:hypothetical protein
MQRLHLQSRHQAREPAGPAGVDHHALLIGRVHLVQLHQERAAPLTEGRMAGAHGIAQLGAGRIVSLPVGEGALQDQDLLATPVTVAFKPTPGATMNAPKTLILTVGVFASLSVFLLMRYPQLRREQFRTSKPFSVVASLLCALVVFLLIACMASLRQ